MGTTIDIWPAVDQAVHAAREVLYNNMHGNYHGLPRTAAWGYPEPYTRDLLLSSLAALVTKDKELMASLRQVLKTPGRATRRLWGTSLRLRMILSTWGQAIRRLCSWSSWRCTGALRAKRIFWRRRPRRH